METTPGDITKRKPSEEFRGRVMLSELQEINDNPHLFAIFEKICKEIDAGLTVKDLKGFSKRLLNICEK